jgi:hypothetical protein
VMLLVIVPALRLLLARRSDERTVVAVQ